MKFRVFEDMLLNSVSAVSKIAAKLYLAWLQRVTAGNSNLRAYPKSMIQKHEEKFRHIQM